MLLPPLSTSSAAPGRTATRHLVADISAHGLGHLAQAAAVLNEIDFARGSGDKVKLTVRSAAPLHTLRERIRHRPFDVVPLRQDNGMVMHDALRVDEERSMDWYRQFHGNYDRRKSDAARQLEALEPDLVFSDVPYLGLDAAALVGVPSVAMCSLNWADIFRVYCGHYDGAFGIYEEILEAYQKAESFLQPTPSMDMPSLSNGQIISPLSFKGHQDRTLLGDAAGDGGKNTRYVLIGVGGYGIDDFPLDVWPSLDDVRWIFPDGVLAQSPGIIQKRNDFVPQSHFDAVMPYIDLLASCDLVVTKTGYGTQVEAVVNRIPAICICRHDWPEHSNLASWHEEFGYVEFIEWNEVGGARFGLLVEDMLGMTSWNKEIVIPSGAREAAQILQQKLSL